MSLELRLGSVGEPCGLEAGRLLDPELTVSCAKLTEAGLIIIAGSTEILPFASYWIRPEVVLIS